MPSRTKESKECESPASSYGAASRLPIDLTSAVVANRLAVLGLLCLPFEIGSLGSIQTAAVTVKVGQIKRELDCVPGLLLHCYVPRVP